MQNPTSFDLDRAIHEWHARLADSPAFQARDLYELQGHLRDSIQRLRSSHLSEEDCFVLATHRLGSAAQLSAEFGKKNWRNIWLERAMWMLAGSLLLGFVNSLSTSLPRTIIVVSQNWLTNPHWLSVLSAAMALGVFALGILLSWQMMVRPPALFQTILRALFRNRAVATFALVLVTSLSFLMNYLSTLHMISTQGYERMGRFMQAQTWASVTMSIACSLFIIITFVCLAKRHLNSSARPSTS